MTTPEAAVVTYREQANAAETGALDEVIEQHGKAFLEAVEHFGDVVAICQRIRRRTNLRGELV